MKGLFKSKKNIVIAVLSVLVTFAVVFVIVGVETGMFARWAIQRENVKYNKVSLDTGLYVGETDGGRFSGQGTFIFMRGETYTGEWLNFAPNGDGVLTVPQVGEYSGGFEDGVKSGEGEIHWENGDEYVGEFGNDKMNGRGQYTFASGAKLYGFFQDNAFYNGQYVYAVDGDSYHVTITDGAVAHAEILFGDGTAYSGDFTTKGINGNGRMTFTNGDVYTGDLSCGKMDGHGEYVRKNGEKYTGAWKNDEIEGEGEYQVGDVRYEGTFSGSAFRKGYCITEVDGREYRYGVSETGAIISLKTVFPDGVSYDGGYDGTDLTGEAEITYPSGDVYKGHVEKGVRNGSGTYTWANGAKYEGNWADNKMSGQGTYYYGTGEYGYKLEGSFIANVPVGTCKFYTSSTKYYLTSWSGGTCTSVSAA